MSAIVKAILRGAGALTLRGFAANYPDYFDDQLAKSPLNDLVDPPFKPSARFSPFKFTPPPRSSSVILYNPDDIVEFERVDISWMFGR